MVWDWAISSEGTAVATWGSDILSLLAIVIALLVALTEQRRANADRVAEDARTREAITATESARLARADQFILTTLAVIAEVQAAARDARDEATDRPTNDFTYSMSTGESMLRKLAPLHDAIQGLRQAVPFDAAIAVALSSVSIAIADFVAGRVAFGVISPSEFARRVGEMDERLSAQHKILEGRLSFSDLVGVGE
jgi:hypothetical protein